MTPSSPPAYRPARLAPRRFLPITSTHIIRKVILRQIAILNYVNPL
jgi:hypothetical protein